jgi:hypothetical protein
MPSHPYEALSVRMLRCSTIAAAAAWGLLTLIMFWAVPIADIGELGKLMHAGGTVARSAILESWGPPVVAAISFLLGFDFLYDVVHNNAVALFVVWGVARCDTPIARSVGVVAAWVLWLDTGLNVFENLGMLHVLRSRSPDRLLSLVAAVFLFRSATLFLGVLVGAGLHAFAFRAASD